MGEYRVDVCDFGLDWNENIVYYGFVLCIGEGNFWFNCS